jgi:hypothetical protein
VVRFGDGMRRYLGPPRIDSAANGLPRTPADARNAGTARALIDEEAGAALLSVIPSNASFARAPERSAITPAA